MDRGAGPHDLEKTRLDLRTAPGRHDKGGRAGFFCLLSGDVDFVLWIDGAETALRLSKPGAYVVAPRGVRNCARPRAPSRMSFVTPGAGTGHGSPHGRAGRARDDRLGAFLENPVSRRKISRALDVSR